MSINVVIASGHPIIRSSLRLLLEREEDLNVVAEAANGREAVILAGYKSPNVILLDFTLPDVNGIAVAREISSRGHDSKIVFFTNETDVSYILEAFKAGAQGYVSADAAQTDLVPAIRVVAGGSPFLSPAIRSGLIEEDTARDRAPLR